MKGIFFCIVLFAFQQLQSQPQWYEGSLVLSDCKVLVGKISLEQKHDLVLYANGDTRIVYPAHKIKSIYYYDNVKNINRRYISIKKDDGIRSSYHLFELVVAGDLSVIRRKKEPSLSIQNEPMDFNYFVYLNDEIIALKKFRRKVFPRLQYDHRLNEYISFNNLSGDRAVDAIRIIEYYNQLLKANEPLAKN
ncbi:hypothetical protein [Chryseolinea sp. H1M3-3]|uniref:hypothetical protein n=1 Tax=Chryseolinea sp. H1M3-3 TaxID=3034144 RepID=UPI0023ED4EE8|nr:hypothetical protein [Chryseolinea sp. H1M3-3]